MHVRSKAVLGAVLLMIGVAVPVRAQGCPGDCNPDGVVAFAELERGLDIHFQPEQLATCWPADPDEDGKVGINEAVLALRASLGLGCDTPLAARAITGPAVVEAGTALGVPGGSTTVQIRLHDNGREVVGVENRLLTTLPSALCFTDATVNPAINKQGSAFSFSNCGNLKALIISLSNVDRIPDGSALYSVEVDIAPWAAPGFYPIQVTETGAADSLGNEVQTIGVAGGVFVGTASSTCGDAAVELDETCDDGNTAGGDGCAANCTHERSIIVDFPESTATIQTTSFQVPLAFRGQQEMLVGSPRASDPDAIIPVVSTVSGTSFDPISIPGLVCACLRAAQLPSSGPDISGVGQFGCGAAGIMDVSYHRSRDHNVDDVDPTCSAGTVETSGHIGVCNGPLAETRYGQHPAGSGVLNAFVSLSLLSDQGQCSTDYAGESPCPFSNYGADCLPCTADDSSIAAPFELALTTGTAEALIDDASNVSGRTVDAASDCGSEACIASVEGAPFSCSELAFGDTVSVGAWAAAQPMLHSPAFGDNVLSVRLGAVAPTPIPTPTRTPTNTRTPTRTRTATRTRTPTATATLPTAEGSLILTRVRIKADTATRLGRDNGTIGAKGVVNVNDPFAGFIDEVLASGFSATFSGAGGIQVMVAWTGPECSERETGRGPVVTCYGSNREKAIFKPTQVPNVFRMTLKGARLALQPPLTADPIFVELRTNASRRVDSIAGCDLRGNVRTTCREAGFVGTTPTPTMTPTFTLPPACPSDCNGNGAVAINELIQTINLGLFSGSNCPAADSDNSGSVDVTDGVRGVRAMLLGCGPALPPPTPGGTGTVGVQAGSVSAVAAGTAAIEVRLDTAGFSVAAVESRLSFDPGANACISYCFVNDDLNKNGNALAVDDCTSMKSWVIGLSDLDPIPDGALLYTCVLDLGTTPGGFPIAVTSVVASDPRGFPLPSIGIAGGVTVGTSAGTLP